MLQPLWLGVVVVRAASRRSNRRCGSKLSVPVLELNVFVAPHAQKCLSLVVHRLCFSFFQAPCHPQKRTEGLLEYCWLELHLGRSLAQPISFAKQPVEPPGDVPGPPRWGKQKQAKYRPGTFPPTFHRRISRFQNLGILDREGETRTTAGSAPLSASRPELALQ